MAAPYNPPIKGQDFVVRISLSDMATVGAFKANPTIAAGDFKVDKDGAGLTNLATLPVVEPAGSVLVKIVLSATEMNADVVTIVGIDQTASKEWADFCLSIPTSDPGEVIGLSVTAGSISMPTDNSAITMGSLGDAALFYDAGLVGTFGFSLYKESSPNTEKLNFKVAVGGEYQIFPAIEGSGQFRDLQVYDWVFNFADSALLPQNPGCQFGSLTAPVANGFLGNITMPNDDAIITMGTGEADIFYDTDWGTIGTNSGFTVYNLNDGANSEELVIRASGGHFEITSWGDGTGTDLDIYLQNTWIITGAGNLQCRLDGQANIGQLGANRPASIYLSSGMVVGSPTGGHKGTGTINAVSVYDDNVILTCMPLQEEFLERGEVDLNKWDATTGGRPHQVSRIFADLMKDGVDPRNPDVYVQAMLAAQTLPGMPSFKDWKQGEHSTGEMISRLWLAMEMLAVAWMSEREKAA